MESESNKLFVTVSMESESNKLFVGGITHGTNATNLREYFSKYGGVKNAQVMRNRVTGVSRGFGFVSFSDQSSMECALQNEEHEILGRRVAVNIPRAIEKKPPRREVSLNDSNQNISPFKINKIFVGGLPPSLTKEEFDRYFETFGRIIDSVIMCNKQDNKPRGFGFVTYDSMESVQKVVMDRFHQLSNKWVDVKRAIPRGEAPIKFYGHDSYQVSWGVEPSSSGYLSYQRPSPSVGGYYYDACANQMGESNKQYHGKQLWVNDSNFALYPSYYYYTPFGQLGNSYFDPTYMNYHVNGNGRQRDDGPSSSFIAKSAMMQEVEVVENRTFGKPNDEISLDIVKSVTIQGAEVVENGPSGKPNDEISLDIVKSVTIQEAEVVENGPSGKPNDETSQVIVHADGVVEAASPCSLCQRPLEVDHE